MTFILISVLSSFFSFKRKPHAVKKGKLATFRTRSCFICCFVIYLADALLRGRLKMIQVYIVCIPQVCLCSWIFIGANEVKHPAEGFNSSVPPGILIPSSECHGLVQCLSHYSATVPHRHAC